MCILCACGGGPGDEARQAVCVCVCVMCLRPGAGVWLPDPVGVGCQHWLAGHRHELVHQLEGSSWPYLILTLLQWHYAII